jgi:hypothetical protein
VVHDDNELLFSVENGLLDSAFLFSVGKFFYPISVMVKALMVKDL